MIVDIKKRALKHLFTGICLLLTLNSFAQAWGVEAFGGMANYQGDLQEKKYTLQGSRFAFGLGASYAFNAHVSVRAMLSYGKVSADDKNNTDPQLVNRNLNFTSAITEFSVAGQVHLFNSFTSRINPYVMAGIALFRHNPYTFDTLGSKYFLQPLGTEGQGLSRYPNFEPYALTQFSIPFGVGIKFAVTEAISIGWEIGMRKTFTDYLDDLSGSYADQGTLLAERGPKAVELAFRTGEVKTGAVYPIEGTVRGGPTYDDWYYFSGITITYRLTPIDQLTYNGKRASSTACPKSVF